MKISRWKYNLITVLILIVFIFILIFTNVTMTSIPVVTVPGSYAAQFADEHALKQGSLPDSISNYFDQRYEIFDFNIHGNEVTVEAYTGQSTELVVPAAIDNMYVTALGDKFFDSLKNVRKVYIPITVTELPGEPVKDIVIQCDSDALFAKDENSGWNIETQYDSNYVNLFMANCPFVYNYVANGIDIAGYAGESSSIVIPSYINGIPVTSVSMNLDGNFDLVVFPETVKSITGNVSTTYMSVEFVFTMLFAIIAFIAVIIFTNIIIPKIVTAKSYSKMLPAIIISFAYLVFQLYIGIKATYTYELSAGMLFLISIVLIFAFVIIEMILFKGVSHSDEIEKKVEVQTSWMKDFRIACSDLPEKVTDSEAKKAVLRFVEDLKYSSPVSAPELVEDEMKIEGCVKALREAIDANDNSVIIRKCEEAAQALALRNRKSKLIK